MKHNIKSFVNILASLSITLCISASCICTSNTAFKNAFAKKAAGEVTEKSFDKGAVSSFTSNVKADIHYTQGEASPVRIKGQSDVIEALSLNLDKEESLVIDFEKDRVLRYDDLDIYICSPKLKSITVNGASSFSNLNPIDTDELTILVNGGGDIEMAGLKAKSLEIQINGVADIRIDGIDVDKLSLTVNGGVDVTLSGKAGKADLEINGAGDVDIHRLECNNRKINTSGACRVSK